MGSPRAAAWIFALAWASAQAARQYLPRHSLSQSCKGIPAQVPGPALTPSPAPRALSHLFPPHSSLCRMFCPSLPGLSPGAAMAAAGLGCALRQGCWSQLEQAPATLHRGTPRSPQAPTPHTPVKIQTSAVTSSI